MHASFRRGRQQAPSLEPCTMSNVHSLSLSQLYKCAIELCHLWHQRFSPVPIYWTLLATGASTKLIPFAFMFSSWLLSVRFVAYSDPGAISVSYLSQRGGQLIFGVAQQSAIIRSLFLHCSAAYHVLTQLFQSSDFTVILWSISYYVCRWSLRHNALHSYKSY